MRGKHFAVALAAIGFLALAGQANAEEQGSNMISLVCTRAGTTAVYHYWIDLSRSTVTQDFSTTVLTTSSAQITATEISWTLVRSAGNIVWTYNMSIDRTNGRYTLDGTGNDGMRGHDEQTCEKGTTPLPATKF